MLVVLYVSNEQSDHSVQLQINSNDIDIYEGIASDLKLKESGSYNISFKR